MGYNIARPQRSVGVVVTAVGTERVTSIAAERLRRAAGQVETGLTVLRGPIVDSGCRQTLFQGDTMFGG